MKLPPRTRLHKLKFYIERLRRELYEVREPQKRLELSQRLDVLIIRWHRLTKTG